MATARITHTPRRVLPGILAAVFIEAFCSGVLIPVATLYIDSAWQSHLGLIGSTQRLAVLVMAHAAVQFFSAPLIGQFSDRFGRRLALYFSLLGAVAGNAIFAYGVYANSFSIVVIGRLVDAATGGTLAIARSVIADVDSNENRITYFGLLGGVGGIGAVLGSIVTLRMVHGPTVIAVMSILLLVTLLSIFNAIIVMQYIPETHRYTRRWQVSITRTWKYLALASRATSHRRLFITLLLFMSGISGYLLLLPELLREYGFVAREAEAFLIALAVLTAVSQAIGAPLVGLFFRSHSILRGLLPLTAGLAIATYAASDSLWWIEILSVATAVCLGIVLAHATALVSGTASKYLQGEILGFDIAMHAAAVVCSSLILIWHPVTTTTAPAVLMFMGLVGAMLVYGLLYRPPAYALTVHKV